MDNPEEAFAVEKQLHGMPEVDQVSISLTDEAVFIEAGYLSDAQISDLVSKTADICENIG